MPVNRENIEDVFTYHPPKNDDQLMSYSRLRATGKSLALAILDETPVCADQQAAIRLVREAVMTANAAIALNGAV